MAAKHIQIADILKTYKEQLCVNIMKKQGIMQLLCLKAI